MGDVTLLDRVIEINDEPVGLRKLLALHGAWGHLELLACTGLFFKLDVFFVNSRQNEWDTRHSTGHITFCCGVVDQRAGLRDAINRDVVLLLGHVGQLDHIEDSVAAATLQLDLRA